MSSNNDCMYEYSVKMYSFRRFSSLIFILFLKKKNVFLKFILNYYIVYSRLLLDVLCNFDFLSHNTN